MSQNPELPEARAVKLPSSIAAAKSSPPMKKEPEPSSDAYECEDDGLGGVGSFVILLIFMFLAFAPFFCNARYGG